METSKQSEYEDFLSRSEDSEDLEFKCERCGNFSSDEICDECLAG